MTVLDVMYALIGGAAAGGVVAFVMYRRGWL